MALFESPRSRQPRVDPRKIRGVGWWTRLQQELADTHNLLRLAVLGLLVLGTLLLLHAPHEPLRWHEGQVPDNNVTARVDFQYPDTEATDLARTEARNNTPNVYERMPTQTKQLADEFNQLIARIQASLKPPPETPAAGGKTPEAPPAESPAPATGGAAGTQPAEGAATAPAAPPAQPADTQADDAGAEGQPKGPDLVELWGLSDRNVEALKKLVGEPDALTRLRAHFQSLLQFVDSQAILSPDRYDVEHRDERRKSILIATPADETNVEYKSREVAQTYNADSNADQAEFRDKVAARARELFQDTALTADLRRRIVDRIADTFAPNLRFSNKLTNIKKDEAANLIPEKVHEFRRGDTLVRAGKAITSAEMRSLRAEHEAYLESITWFGHAAAILGSIVLVGLLVGVGIGYTRLTQPNVLERPIRAFVLVVLLLVVMAIAKFFYPQLQQGMLVFPLTIAAMIVAIAYNRRYAIMLTWGMILLVTLVARLNDYDTVVLLVIGTSVAVFQLGEIRSRSKLVRVGLVTGLAYFLTVWGLEIVWSRELGWSTLLRSGLIGLLGGVLPGFIILGVLPFIERIFNVVTSISLLELCDANQPALRKLAIEAPGTYQHSLQLGSIVEPAAELIGANGLLARVGAYFHDIGKVNKPQYFIENVSQLAGRPSHDKLKPQMSKLIITSHIKDGLDMARQYGLPKVVNNFIAEHHGTTIIEYFYNLAQQAGEEVKDVEYRYPGPKPQSRETAILMLADGCEGAVRAIKEPTAPKIEDRVHEIVMKRLMDGQLDESGLTLNDVRVVEQSLIKSLISIYHGRIPYPDQEEAEPSPGNGNAASDQSPAATWPSQEKPAADE